MEPDTIEESRRFRKRDIFYLAIFVLLVLSVISHSAQDLAVLAGGTSAPIQNWIGYGGAYIARILFFTFGLAVYPLIIMAGFSVIRSFLPYPLKRKGYVWAYLALALGLVLLYGLYPGNETFLQWTDKLGIGRNAELAKNSALSGGLLGQLFSAPEIPGQAHAGLLRRLINEVGTIIVSLALITFAAVLIIWADVSGIMTTIKKRKKEKAAMPASGIRTRKEEPELPPFDPGFDMDHGKMAFQETPDPSTAAEVEKKSLLERLRGMFHESSSADNTEQNKEEPVPAASTPGAPDDEDGYVIVPPRSNTLPANNSTPVQQPFSRPVTVQPAPQPAVQQPAPQPASRPDSVDTPVGVQPAIKQFADNESDRARSSAPTQNNCPDYELPSVKMLDQHNDAKTEDMDYLEKGRERLQQVLDSFSVAGHVENIVVGPRVTRFEVQLDEGVEVNKITRISNNIAMKMEASSVRILAPIPGRDAVGIEVPNKVSSTVYIRSVMESEAWVQNTKPIPIVLGRDVEGKAVVTDLARAPHMLIAGSTGSGKSVCMNTLIMSLLFKFSPEQLRLILVDPKVVEMAAYASIPHLITPVVNDPKKVPLALRWGVNEMEHRYRLMAKVLAKDIKTFNSRPPENPPVLDDDGEPIPAKLPFLVIIIDELADIMMTEAKKDVENSICRIAQKGRAAGIHLVIATQTPRKDVITGMIKANLPVKIAFKVGSNMDSRVILDTGGAEKLLGMGDLLFCPPGASNLERIQMTLVTDSEIQRIVDFCSSQVEQHFDSCVLAEDVEIKDGTGTAPVPNVPAADDEWEEETPCSPEVVDSAIAKYLQPGDSPLLKQALELVINERQASISFFQRRLGIGYNKSAELVDQLEQRNIISKPLGGGQKRDILILDGLEVAD